MTCKFEIPHISVFAISAQIIYRAIWRGICHKYDCVDNPANVYTDTPAIKLHRHTVFTVTHITRMSKYTPFKPVSNHLILVYNTPEWTTVRHTRAHTHTQLVNGNQDDNTEP